MNTFLLARFVFVIPAVEAPPIKLHASHVPPSHLANMQHLEEKLHKELMPKTTFMHPIARGMKMQFPEVRLIQYDCGKDKAIIIFSLTKSTRGKKKLKNLRTTGELCCSKEG